MKLLILDSATKTIKIAMSGAAATTNPDFTVAYADNNGPTFTEFANDGVLNNALDVIAVTAPANGTRRIIRQITIHNRDTQTNTITIKYDNNGTQRVITRATLNPGDTWTMDGTYDLNGHYKQIGSALPSQNGQAGKFLKTDGTTASWQPAEVTTGKAIAMAIVFGG